jgi:FecR protein
MKKLGLQLFIAAASATLLIAQSPAVPDARLAIRSGIVEVQRGNIWVPITISEPLRAGERIRTGSGSLAAIEFGQGKVVTLNEQSVVQIGPIGSTGSSGGAAIVQLENGSMKVFSTSDIQIAAKDTTLETADRPVDLELGYQSDKLNLTVFSGAVRNGSMIIHGGNDDPTVRTYTANRNLRRNDSYGQQIVVDPTFYVYPYFMYGNPNPNAGRIVPPVVNNPTNPGYRPTQVVPPMADPIRVPVTQP